MGFVWRGGDDEYLMFLTCFYTKMWGMDAKMRGEWEIGKAVKKGMQWGDCLHICGYTNDFTWLAVYLNGIKSSGLWMMYFESITFIYADLDWWFDSTCYYKGDETP